MRKLIAIALVCAPGLALAAPPAKSYNVDPNNLQTGLVTIFCPDPNISGASVPCSFGSGGGSGSGGTVTQGPGGSASSPWYEQITAGTAAIGSVSVSNFPTTQPVSGTVAVTGAYQATQPVSAASLPLPAGAATSANQTAPVVAGTSAGSGEPVQGINNGVPISTTPPAGAWSAPTNSTTSGTANTAVALFGAGNITKACFVQNISTTASITLDFGGGTPSSMVSPYLLAPGASTVCAGVIPTSAVNMWSASTSVAVYGGRS